MRMGVAMHCGVEDHCPGSWAPGSFWLEWLLWFFSQYPGTVFTGTTFALAPWIIIAAGVGHMHCNPIVHVHIDHFSVLLSCVLLVQYQDTGRGEPQKPCWSRRAGSPWTWTVVSYSPSVWNPTEHTLIVTPTLMMFSAPVYSINFFSNVSYACYTLLYSSITSCHACIIYHAPACMHMHSLNWRQVLYVDACTCKWHSVAL